MVALNESKQLLISGKIWPLTLLNMKFHKVGHWSSRNLNEGSNADTYLPATYALPQIEEDCFE